MGAKIQVFKTVSITDPVPRFTVRHRGRLTHFETLNEVVGGAMRALYTENGGNIHISAGLSFQPEWDIERVRWDDDKVYFCEAFSDEMKREFWNTLISLTSAE